MMNALRPLTLLALILGLVLPSACANSDFAGTAGKTKDTKGGKDSDADDDDDDEDTDSEKNDAGDTDDDDTDEDGDIKDPAIDETTDSSGMILGDLGGDGDEAKPFVPRFALLINDIKCGFCHTQVRGDVVSTAAVSGVRDDTVATVNGGWYASHTFAPPGSKVNVTNGVQQNFSGKPLPNDVDGDGKADFPVFSPSGIEDLMKGSVLSSEDDVSHTKSGNAIFIGTESNPIEIKGEVLIRGDVVIKGVYKGIGNIYATGNIYIPGDLKAANSAFPFSEDKTEALKQAKAAIKSKKDALALATTKSIIVGDFLKRSNGSIFEHGDAPPETQAGAIGLYNVFNWYKGGESGISSLFAGSPQPCMEGGHPNFNASISLVEAYLYAEQNVAGMARNNSYAINGGVIAKDFHIVSSARNCPGGPHPVHGYDSKWSYINYDYRMKAGLLLLKQLHKYFK